MRNILITGANRGLGLAVAKIAAEKKLDIYATARSQPALEMAFTSNDIDLQGSMRFDLEASDPEEIRAQLRALPNLDIIVHCASPYSRDPFSETTTQQLTAYTRAMLNDQIFLQEACRKLATPQGVILLAGAMIGQPGELMRGPLSLYKNHLRALGEVIKYEQQDIRVHCMNLGTFTEEEKPGHLTTSQVAVKFMEVAEDSSTEGYDIDLRTEADKQILASMHPKKNKAELETSVQAANSRGFCNIL